MIGTKLFGDTATGSNRSFAFEELEGEIVQDVTDGMELDQIENDTAGLMPQLEAMRNIASLTNFALSQESHDSGSFYIMMHALHQHHATFGIGTEEFSTTYALESNEIATIAGQSAVSRKDFVGNTDGPGWMQRVKDTAKSVGATIKEALKKAIAFIGKKIGQVLAWIKTKSTVQTTVAKVKAAYEKVKTMATPSKDSRLRIIGNYLKAAGKVASLWAKITALTVKIKVSKYYKDGKVISDEELNKMIADAAKANPEKAAEAAKIIREKHTAMIALVHKQITFISAAKRLANHITTRSLSTASFHNDDLESLKAIEENSAKTEKAMNIFERAWDILSKAVEEGLGAVESDKDESPELAQAVTRAADACQTVLEENNNIVLTGSD